jgi:crossover junction endodeoxyribonuclease RusA
MTLMVALPYPPSSNRIWRAVNGRNIKSAVYRQWEAKCRQVVATGAQTVHGPYAIAYVAQRPDNRRRDLGNLEKAASDMLQTLGVIEDDCQCQSISLKWAEGKPVGAGAILLVEITPQ